MALSTSNSRDDQLVARNLLNSAGISPYQPVRSAENLKKLLNESSTNSSSAVAGAYGFQGPLLRKFGEKGHEVVGVRAGKTEGTFDVTLRFRRGTQEQPRGTLDMTVTVEKPQYDSFRGDLRYATIAARPK